MLFLPYLDVDAAGDGVIRIHCSMQQFAWHVDTTVEIHLGHGDRVGLFQADKLEVGDLIDLQPDCDAGATCRTTRFAGAA